MYTHASKTSDFFEDDDVPEDFRLTLSEHTALIERFKQDINSHKPSEGFHRHKFDNNCAWYEREGTKKPVRIERYVVGNQERYSVDVVPYVGY